jgi:hypothetical protein
MTLDETAALMKAIAGPIAEVVHSATQPLLDRIRKLEDRASELENELKDEQR